LVRCRGRGVGGNPDAPVSAQAIRGVAVGIIAEQMATAATERLDAVANTVRDDGQGDPVERAAKRLVKVNPKARVANVLVEVDANELADLCASVDKATDDEALLAVAKVIGAGCREVAGRRVSVRADQLLALAAFGTV
jgi:hypothetical protein